MPLDLDIEVFKEPRGFIRCLEFFFAIVAFSTLANFSTEFSFDIKCKNATLDDQKILEVQVDYPFNIASTKPIDLSKRKPCGVTFTSDEDKYSKITFLENFNFSSDAQFFVFVGVVSFLYAGLSLLLYLRYPDQYLDDPKSYPKIDFILSSVLGMFWLAGAAAWANGLTGLKFACDAENWLSRSGYGGVCTKATNQDLVVDRVASCNSISTGSFAGANGAVFLGFLNFLLWAANLWFLYKETSWFGGGKQVQDTDGVKRRGEPDGE